MCVCVCACVCVRAYLIMSLQIFCFLNYLFVEVTLATTLYKLHVYNNIFLLCTLQLTTKNSISICYHIVDPLYLFHSPSDHPFLSGDHYVLYIYLFGFIYSGFVFFIFYMSEITWYLSFFIWLISFSIILLRYIHVERWYWAVLYHFCDWVVCIPVYTYLSIYVMYHQWWVWGWWINLLW